MLPFCTVSLSEVLSVPALALALIVLCSPCFSRLCRARSGQDALQLHRRPRPPPWGADLIDDNALPQAIELLKFEVQIYSDTSSGHATLAEAYEKSGQNQLALQNYKKALAINPENEDAKQALKKLESSAPAKN
jgi:tetratricopeptide (TPR) repeat protein